MLHIWHLLSFQVLNCLVPISLLAFEGLDHAVLELGEVGWFIEVVLADWVGEDLRFLALP